MNNWENKPEVKKGKIGEETVDRYLRRRGLIPYYPDKAVGSHPFDRLCGSKNKRVIVIAESKAKARRTKYNDTGFNLTHYKQYKYLEQKYNLPVWIFFVDENIGKIYGNSLQELDKYYWDNLKQKQYPSIETASGGDVIVYFPMAKMKPVADLAESEIIELKKYSQRNYEYPK